MEKYITIKVTSTKNDIFYKFIHRNFPSLLSPKIALRENIKELEKCINIANNIITQEMVHVKSIGDKTMWLNENQRKNTKYSPFYSKNANDEIQILVNPRKKAYVADLIFRSILFY